MMMPSHYTFHDRAALTLFTFSVLEQSKEENCDLL